MRGSQILRTGSLHCNKREKERAEIRHLLEWNIHIEKTSHQNGRELPNFQPETKKIKKETHKDHYRKDDTSKSSSLVIL